MEQKTISGPGGTSRKPLTPDGLADMDDDEFDKATKGKDWAKLWS